MENERALDMKKSLYGLKQGLKQWYKKFDPFIHDESWFYEDINRFMCLFQAIIE